MRKSKTKTKKLAKASFKNDKLPIIEHIYELRRRLFYVAVSIGLGSILAYAVQQQIVAVLLRPSHGQHFIYTSPLGGINFLFSVCLDIGVLVSIPLIVYHLLSFLQPLMHRSTTRFIVIGSSIAGIVALGGIAFGYFVGLPAALNFLLHQFTSAQIKPLVTIQAYLSFVSIYLLGSALMFQLPLFLIFINRIKPLKPSGLLHYERHVIVIAFIIGFIMNPTPNLIDQLLVVAPIILMYQLGILLIWFINRGSKLSRLERLMAHDADLRAQRVRQAGRLQPVTAPHPSSLPSPVIGQAAMVPVAPAAVQPAIVRRHHYVNDFVPARRQQYRNLSVEPVE